MYHSFSRNRGRGYTVGSYVVSLFLAFLPPTTQTEDKMKGGLLLDIVVTKSPTVFELLSSED